MNPKTPPLATTIATATGALFALQYSADASIVYTSLNTVLTAVPGQNVNMGFDLDGGGNDFELNIYNSPNVFAVAGMQPLGKGQILIDSNLASLHRVPAGGVIGAGAAGYWAATSGWVARGATVGGNYGQFLPGQPGFAGVRLSLGNGNFDYAWVRFQVDTDASGFPTQLTAIDMAYENTPNVPITTPGGVPEPGTTALLALAGAGAAFLQRKRKAA